MKFYNYINEGRSQTIDLDYTLEYIEYNCSEIVNNYRKTKNYIYRGIPNTKPFLKISPKSFTRKSANTLNYYTILFDYLLDSWKNWPNRSESIVCTSDSSNAAGYGNLFLVFPSNKNYIAKCPADDMWSSFMKNIYTDLDMFNQGLKKLMYKINPGDVVDFSPEELKQVLNHVKTSLHNDEDFLEYAKQKAPWLRKLIDDILVSGEDMSMIEFLNYTLHPKRNGFELVNTSKGIGSDSGVELWTTADSVMVNINRGMPKEINELIKEDF